MKPAPPLSPTKLEFLARKAHVEAIAAEHGLDLATASGQMAASRLEQGLPIPPTAGRPPSSAILMQPAVAS